MKQQIGLRAGKHHWALFIPLGHHLPLKLQMYFLKPLQQRALRL